MCSRKGVLRIEGDDIESITNDIVGNQIDKNNKLERKQRKINQNLNSLQ